MAESYRVTVAVEKGADFAFCPQILGCCTQVNTYEEALEDMREL